MWRRDLAWSEVTLLVTALITLVFDVDTTLRVPLIKKNVVFKHHFLKLDLPTKYQCMELCVAFALCRSIYYNGKGECGINSDSKDRQVRSGYAFDSPSRTDVPQAIAVRSCTTHACGIDEMCVGASSDSTCVKNGRTVVKCPVRSVRRGNSCYKLFNIKIGWYEAKDFCHKEGAMLVEIHSGDIGVYLAGIVFFLGGAIGVDSQGTYWTGLAYSCTQSAWIWEGTGKTLLNTSYHKFVPTIPTMQDDMCMGVSYGNGTFDRTWNSVDCDQKNVFVCQYESPDFWP